MLFSDVQQCKSNRHNLHMGDYSDLFVRFVSYVIMIVFLQIWDYNGQCHHQLHCEKAGGDMVAEVGQMLSLKRTVLAVGWTKYVCFTCCWCHYK